MNIYEETKVYVVVHQGSTYRRLCANGWEQYVDDGIWTVVENELASELEREFNFI